MQLHIFAYMQLPITKKGIAAIVPQSWISVLSLNIDIEWSDCTKKMFICQVS